MRKLCVWKKNRENQSPEEISGKETNRLEGEDGAWTAYLQAQNALRAAQRRQIEAQALANIYRGECKLHKLAA